MLLQCIDIDAFRVSEKTATPTSVVLMAINTFLAMCYCKWMMREGLGNWPGSFLRLRSHCGRGCSPLVAYWVLMCIDWY